MKISECADTEVSLRNWFIKCRCLKIPINGPIFKEKVKLLVTELDHK